MSNEYDVSLFGDAGFDYTDQERANLTLIKAYRAAKIGDRKSFLAPGFRRRRVGLKHINELWPLPADFVPVESSPGGDPVSGGMDDKSIGNRINTFVHLTAKGNLVWGVFRVEGTHTGDIAGLGPTNREVDLTEAAMWRVEDRLITDAWYFGDELGLLISLGVQIPEDAL
ncbi:MAG: ester cyclase [Acidimicrobiia bacterium]